MLEFLRKIVILKMIINNFLIIILILIIVISSLILLYFYLRNIPSLKVNFKLTSFSIKNNLYYFPIMY